MSSAMNANNSSAILQCRQLAIGFGDHALIQPFDWTVHAGERWAILGVNGSGKTSLLHALLGAPMGEPQHSLSKIELMGEKLDELSPRQQAQWRVWVPQRYEEPFTITVAQALRSVAPFATEEQMTAQLAQFGLQAHRHIWVHQLSGGERQRLTWAMAALRVAISSGSSRLWLLDEPFSAQDIAWQKRLLTFLSQREGAVVASIHDLNQVALFATHVLLLGQGCVLAQGTRESVMTSEWLSQAYGVEIVVDETGWVRW